jgi:hypothetical protein
MSELGELLELLHEARHRYRTARGVMRRRHNWRLTQEAMKRSNARSRRGGSTGQVMMFASRGGAEAQPDVHEEVIRFWVEPPDRLRHEVESSGRSHTTVIDGDTWWMYSPEWGATSNAGLTDEETGNMSGGGDEPSLEETERDGIRYVVFDGEPDQGMGAAVRFERDGTAVQLQSQDLAAETLLQLATSLRPAE